MLVDVVGAAVACADVVVEAEVVVVLDVVVEVVVEPLSAAVVTLLDVPLYDAAAIAPNVPTAATPASVVPIVIDRSRPTARSRSCGLRRVALFMDRSVRDRSFRVDDGARRHRAVASAPQNSPMNWLGDLGSAVLGAAYTYRIALAVASLVGVVILVVIARRRRWLDRIRRHPRAFVAVLVPTLAVVLPIGWYLASPLVLSASIDEPPPAVAIQATPHPSPVEAPALSPAAVPPSIVSSAAPSSEPPAPLIARSGAFHGSDDFHFGRGTARLIETSPGQFVVRLEGFAVRNGPDLYVFLSPSADGYAGGAIELGKLKADTGNQNYAVPAGALDDPGRAASVVIWCKQFSHLFATAPLAA